MALNRPEVSVVVASHEREAGLRVLLEALGAQTLERDLWEVIVVHTYDPATVAAVFDRHELTRAGLLRHVGIDPSRARPSVQRNIGWRAARGPRIAFTDDDCRPEPTWLERLLAASRARPGAIVQGATRADPLDEHQFARTHFSALHVDPPNRFMQTCNILYQAEVLERIDGFDEHAITGEDIDLGLRAQEAGVPLTGAPDALVYHAIVGMSMLEKIHSQRKWQHLAYVVKRHPRLRRDCAMGIWWKPEHLGAVVALLSLAGASRRRWMLAGVLPYLQIERLRHGPGTRQQLRAIWEIPPHWVVEIAEVGTFIRGSLRYRTLLL